MRIAFQKPHSRNNHPRSAIPALQSILHQKGLLQWMQRPVVFNPLNSSNRLPSHAPNLSNARSPRHSINQDSASPALPLPTTILRSSQPHLIPQNRKQRGFPLRSNPPPSPIHH